MCVIAVVGALGKMGVPICECLVERGFDVRKVDSRGSLRSLNDLGERVDLVVDFSVKEMSLDVLRFCVEHGVKLVMGTTGQGAFFFDQLGFAATKIPIMKCDNFSENVFLFTRLVQQFAREFGGEIAVVEAHHRGKLDAPSGTAKSIVSAIGDAGYAQGVGVASLRGGTVFGRHEVHFFADDEEIVLTHSSFSRKPFVNGLLHAVDFMLTQSRPGLFSMSDFVFEQSFGLGDMDEHM